VWDRPVGKCVIMNKENHEERDKAFVCTKVARMGAGVGGKMGKT